jgi:acyl-CoA dehydrogenase
MDETQDLLSEAIARIFGDLCTKALLDAAERGVWPEALWRALADGGFTAIALSEEGGASDVPAAGLARAFTLFRAAGRAAAPVPLVETVLANWLLDGAGMMPVPGPLAGAPAHQGELSIYERRPAGVLLAGVLRQVPWAARAKALAVLAEGTEGTLLCLVEREKCRIETGRNPAGEPRDTVHLDRVLLDSAHTAPASVSTAAMLALAAAARATQMAGALARVLEFSVRFASERIQFGRPIGQFQTIQHALAVLATEVAAADAVCAAAAGAAGRTDFVLYAAAAKIRAGEAVTTGAAIAHQVHGAIGFTAEHRLQHFTRRLWAWRDEFGGEATWALALGRRILDPSAPRLWEMLTS